MLPYERRPRVCPAIEEEGDFVHHAVVSKSAIEGPEAVGLLFPGRTAAWR